MNLQQLEYIIAVDTHKHFTKAAENCFVTQPTLSMMIQKLEEELGVKIFDRSRQPVKITPIGEKIIAQARRVLRESKTLHEIITDDKELVSGELKIAIIPTLAPYLIPLFINSYLQKYPLLKLKIIELQTQQIVEKLLNDSIDIGILVTPLKDNTFIEAPLFYERLLAYISPTEKAWKKKYLLPRDIDLNRLWLLEEGHCFRNQVINFCELKKAGNYDNNFEYEAGSIETLKRIVEQNYGITIIPELAAQGKDKKYIRTFKSPEPLREVSLVYQQHYIKRQLVEALKNEIISNLPEQVRSSKKGAIVGIE